MGFFGRKDNEHDTHDPARDGADSTFDTFDSDGNRVRYTPDDFDEILTTSEAHEMRRLIGLGWLLLDEQVSTDPGRRSSWIDTAFRRSAGRVLAAQDDPEYKPPSDATTYVLGCLKDGATGTRT